MAKVTYTVKKGDTLSGIASAHGTTVDNLAKLNNISNPDVITVGQVLTISGASSTENPSVTAKSAADSNMAWVYMFGLQANSDNVIYAAWTWSTPHTKHYRIMWYYDTGNFKWFIGSDTTTEQYQATYTPPKNALRVRFFVLPVSETYKSNDQDVSYWTAEWSTELIYDLSDNPPEKPPVPTVTVDNFKLTARVDNVDLNAESIEFQVLVNDKDICNTGIVDIYRSAAIFTHDIVAGDIYRVRCRSKRGSSYSDWSEYSANVSTIPRTPTAIKSCKATSATSVKLVWEAAKAATSYDIAYTTKKSNFEGSDAITIRNNITTTQYEITGLESGQQYFFRVRAVNDKGTSEWTDIVSVTIGTEPTAPTTWSSNTTIMVGEELILYWVHNSEDGSSQKYAELELYIDDEKNVYTIRNDSEEDETSVYKMDTTQYSAGVKIKWRVRTSGITGVYGDWSIQRTVDIYAPATLQLNIENNNSQVTNTITSFPFYITGIAGPDNQTPIGYHVSIISNKHYEKVDAIGNKNIVTNGSEIYSKYFNADGNLHLEMTPGDIDLENNIPYTLVCTLSMNTGLNVTETKQFTVSWVDVSYTPNAEITYDPKTLTASIKPYCGHYSIVYREVERNSEGEWIKKSTTHKDLVGESVDNAFTTDGLIVYSGTQNGKTVYFCVENSDTQEFIEGVTLSVYRREYDGSFIEIGSGLENTNNTFVTDPHPSLDFARYRIVAVSNDTGAIGYKDILGYPIHETSAVIQWDESWTEFDMVSTDVMETPPWSGSLLKLPYNIDVSDSNTSDVTLVKYIGRTHPISYYGTQLGTTATWSMEIPKSDKDTLYALRRLAIWMGDVYVREPSGSGYWANVSVSFKQTHCVLTIPITLEITRVVGGV